MLSWPLSYPSEACVDAVLEDFAVDVPAFLEADGLADPYGPVWDESIGDTRLGTLLAGARLLHVVEFGPAATLGTKAMQDALDDLGTGAVRLGPLWYDYVVSRVKSVTVDDTGPADAGLTWDGVLLWNLEDRDALSAVALLMHEGRHRDGFDHVICSDGRAVCDDGRQGPVGFQLAVHERAQAITADPVLVDREAERIAWLRGRLL